MSIMCNPGLNQSLVTTDFVEQIVLNIYGLIISELGVSIAIYSPDLIVRTLQKPRPELRVTNVPIH